MLHSEDKRTVAQSLYRAWRKIHPGLPKSREDVHNAIELMDTQPKLIHVDFELTMHTVLNNVFPVTNLKCCRFHLGQAWYRKMQNLGLSQDYNDSESAIGKWLKQSFGLHFLDPTEIEDCFVEDYMASAPQDERCIKYAEYLVENYVTTDSRYPSML